jgi:hypothetical protein
VSVQVPEFVDTQVKTLHFEYLLAEHGGFLRFSQTLSDHLEQIAGALEDPESAQEELRGFVHHFIRPLGLDRPATPIAADAVERVAAASTRPESRLARAITPVSWLVGLGLVSGNRRARARAIEAAGTTLASWLEQTAKGAEGRPVAAAMRRSAVLVRSTSKHIARSWRNDAPAGTRRGRADQNGPPAFTPGHPLKSFRLDRSRVLAASAYLPRDADEAALALERAREVARRVRDEVVKMRPGEPLRALDSGLATVLEDDPGALALLRRYAGDESTSSAYTTANSLSTALATRMRALHRAGVAGAVAPEPALLGASGIAVDGGVMTFEALRHATILAGLEHASVLPDLDAAVRPSVWELGGGWGGLAYHLKLRCPHARFIIVDEPERFLISAVYLLTVFPSASASFLTADSSNGSPPLDSADFGFVPAWADASLLGSPTVTLSVDPAMRLGQPAFRRWVGAAHDAGSRYIYTVGPWGDDHSAAIDAVTECFWPHPVPGVNGDRHIFGWPRLRR